MVRMLDPDEQIRRCTLARFELFRKITQTALARPDVLWSRHSRSVRIWKSTSRYAIQAKMIRKCHRKSHVEPQFTVSSLLD